MNGLPVVCDRVLRWGLVTLIVFTPFAFGTVEPWSIALMEWGVGTLLLIFVLSRLWPAVQVGSGSVRPTGLELPIGLFLAICMLQTVPLPLGWLGRISEGSARMYREVEWPPRVVSANPAIEMTAGQDPLQELHEPDRRPVSVHPRATWHRIRLLASFAALFLLVSWWVDRVERVFFVLKTVMIVGFLVAVHGLVQFLTWNEKIFWFRRVTSVSVFGPFVNHNHFAGYVEMVIPVAISLAASLVDVRRRAYASRGAPGPGSLEERSLLGQSVLTLFTCLILVVSLFFSQSRAGILSAVIGGSVLFILLWRRIASRAVALSVGMALPVLVVGLIAWIGADAVTKQLGTYPAIRSDASFRLRLIVWDNVLRRLPDYLWLGSGLGTFEESFAPLTPPGSAARWDMAHNDYLQVLWETGVLGFGAFLLGGVLFARRYWWPALRSRGHPLSLFRVGIAVSLLSIALHSLVDFSLQIGANGFLCTLLAGLLVSLHRATGTEIGARRAGRPAA